MSLPSIPSVTDSVSSRSAYWEHARDNKGTVRHKAPTFDENDPVTWLRLMQQHLEITGLGDTIEQEPVFGQYTLRARPSDAASEGISWRTVNGAKLTVEETAAFVRCTDAFAIITQALSTAPIAYKQISSTIENGNAHALWRVIKKYVEETRGQTGTRLLSKLVTARMHNDETPLQYGIRLQSELTLVRAHGKDIDEDLLKDRFVNFMTAPYIGVASQLAVLSDDKSLSELIDAAARVGAAQAATMSNTRRNGGDSRSTHQANAGETLKKGCYRCGAHDHIKQNCPQAREQDTSKKSGQDHGSSDRSSSSSRPTCEVCQKPGHTVDRCFTLQRAEKLLRDRNGSSSKKDPQ